MKSEIQILREYQAYDSRLKICEILETSDVLSDEAVGWLIDKLNTLSMNAMKQAGLDVRGQLDFADTVFFDLALSDANKIAILSDCEGQEKRIEALRESK